MNKQDQYLGNPNLKKGHTKSRFTKEQIQEVLKCLDDPKYFISTYLKIVTIDKGLVPLRCMIFKRIWLIHFMRIGLQYVSCLDKVGNQLS